MTTNDIHGIEAGWSVKSADGETVGSVEETTDTYILVKSGLLNATHRYLPAAVLEHVRPEVKEIGISLVKEEVETGDWSEIPTLIRGLKDERQFTRSLCIQALQGATGETFGFDPKADLTDRVRAIDSWEVWWRARTGEGLLGKNG